MIVEAWSWSADVCSNQWASCVISWWGWNGSWERNCCARARGDGVLVQEGVCLLAPRNNVYYQGSRCKWRRIVRGEICDENYYDVLQISLYRSIRVFFTWRWRGKTCLLRREHRSQSLSHLLFCRNLGMWNTYEILILVQLSLVHDICRREVVICNNFHVQNLSQDTTLDSSWPCLDSDRIQLLFST